MTLRASLGWSTIPRIDSVLEQILKLGEQGQAQAAAQAAAQFRVPVLGEHGDGDLASA
jgi:hypothetical protein